MQNVKIIECPRDAMQGIKDWIPTIEEQEIVRDRIKEKINMKPSWYRKTTYDQNLKYLIDKLMIDYL